ncbi:hypothetical protein ABFT80_27430 [Mesorhizobium sp. SB112]
MNLSMQLTMDGLVRALRTRLHALAEDVERKQEERPARPPREADDERGG